MLSAVLLFLSKLLESNTVTYVRAMSWLMLLLALAQHPAQPSVGI